MLDSSQLLKKLHDDPVFKALFGMVNQSQKEEIEKALNEIVALGADAAVGMSKTVAATESEIKSHLAPEKVVKDV